jgi:hypothetical protein
MMGDVRVTAEQKSGAFLGKIGIGLAIAVVIGVVVIITLFSFLRSDPGEDITWVG